MKKLIILLALVAISHSIVFSQGCLPEGITFTTQEQIDNFQTNYPDCTEIEGDVHIHGDDITNLQGLNVITSIVGKLWMQNNDALTGLSGLESLTSVGGDLWFIHNVAVTSILGFENLSSIGGNLWIEDNFALTSLTGLENLSLVAGNLGIGDNDSLTSLEGLENLNYLGGSLAIGLNGTLTSLTGLESLTSIVGYLSIVSNSNLTNLTGIGNLTSIGGDLIISGNDSLNSLTGLEDILSNSIASLYIYYNFSLSECDVQSICEYLAAPNGTIEIHDNAPGCCSQDEVMDACDTQCLYEGITFTTQEQIDNFQTNYPGCTEIEGDVQIDGEDISNLNGLDVLTSIGGDFLFGIDDYSWNHNPALLSLTGLDNLTSIEGDLNIWQNGALNNFEGLNSLTSIGGDLHIIDNSSMTSFTGLENLTTIGEDLGLYNYMTENPYLINFSGLDNLITIGGNLSIFHVVYFENLAGLNNLTSVGSSLVLNYNYSLNNLNELTNLTSVGNDIYIESNALSDLTGLDSIEAGSISNLYITNNFYLTECDVQSICEYLAAPNGTIKIHDNAPGCNSQAEVEEACLNSSRRKSNKGEITLFPNPATSFITINVNGGQPIEEAIIYNHLGQKALEALPVNNTVDVSALKPGIYFLEVITSESRAGTKLLVE